MKLTVIGMWGGFPKKDGPCAGYLLEHKGVSVLLDCGSGVLVKLQEFADLNTIHHVVLSHYHYDHYSDAGAYMFSRLVNTQLGRVDKPLTIYGPNDPLKKQEFSSVPYTRFQPIGEEIEVNIGPFQFAFQENIHPVETYSIKVTCEDKCLVYTADTSFSEELVKFSTGADLLIAECSLYEEMDGKQSGHMNAYEAGVLAREAGARQTILIHLPHYGELGDLLKSARSAGGKHISLAETGMMIDLNH